LDNHIKDIISTSYTKNNKFRNSDVVSLWKVKEFQNFINELSIRGLSNVLDLGAGSGIFGQMFLEKNYIVKCIDISEGMIEFCKNRGLDSEVMDFYNMNFRDGSYEGIWSMNTLLHVPKASIEYVLREVHRVLSDTGIAFVGLYGGKSFEGIWNEDFYTPKRYFSFYHDEEIKEIIGDIFTIKQFKSYDVGRNGFNFQSMLICK
jgi:ubiquinone/menaquinone biosynthesis C-methylase UbiE